MIPTQRTLPKLNVDGSSPFTRFHQDDGQKTALGRTLRKVLGWADPPPRPSVLPHDHPGHGGGPRRSRRCRVRIRTSSAWCWNMAAPQAGGRTASWRFKATERYSSSKPIFRNPVGSRLSTPPELQPKKNTRPLRCAERLNACRLAARNPGIRRRRDRGDLGCQP